MEKKADIRLRILTIRDSMPEEEVFKKSEKIENQVMETLEFQNARSLFLYMDFRNEVKTDQLLDVALCSGKKVYLPKISNGSMEFYRVEEKHQVEKGCYGIFEPISKEKSKETNGLMILPGSAFDPAGNRIGYGKGYYDQYLMKHPDFIRFAIAYQFQLVKEIPASAYDVCVDRIFTESGQIYPKTIGQIR